MSYLDAAFTAERQVVPLLRQLRDASRQEKGSIRFEVLQRTTPTNQFLMLESWNEQSDLDAHTAGASVKRFREAIAPHLIAPLDERLHVTTDIESARSGAWAPSGALSVVTHVDVPPGSREATAALLVRLAEQARREAGNLRFDVIHQRPRTNHFTLIEAWKDQGAANAHELSSHTRAFRTELTPMLGALHDQRWYKPL